MIALPPFDVGAVHESETWALPAVAATDVGVPGVVYGVTAEEAVEYVPVPALLIAATRNTYEVPLVRPVTVTEVVVETESENNVHEVPSVDY